MHNDHNKNLRLEKVRIAMKGDLLIDLSVTIDAGEIVTIMGPSGSGKSTLLAYIGGFLARGFEASGQVLLATGPMSPGCPPSGAISVFCSRTLCSFPHLSVGGNLAFGLTSSVRGRKARHARMLEALEGIDLSGFRGSGPGNLVRRAEGACGPLPGCCCPSLVRIAAR